MKFQGATSTNFSPSPLLWIGVAGVVLLSGEAALLATWAILGGTAVITAVLALLSWRSANHSGRALAIGLVALALSLGIAAGRMARFGSDPGTLQVGAVRDATSRRDRFLGMAVSAAQHTADLALQRVSKPGSVEVPRLGDLIAGGPVERAVAVLSGDSVIALAGPHRFLPRPGRVPAFLVNTPFAHLLVIRVTGGTREAQVTLLLDAAPGLPVAGPSLADRVGGWQGVRWTWDAPLDRPLDYPTLEAARAGVSRAMHAGVPSSGAVLARESGVVRWLVGGGLILLALVILFTAELPAARAGALLVPLWALIRSSSPTGAFPPLLFQVLFGATLLLLGAIALTSRPERRTAGRLAAAVLLLLVFLPLLTLVANTVVPVIDTRAIGIWFCWEAGFSLAAAGFLGLATAFVREPDDAEATSTWGLLAAVAASLVGVAGIEAWVPGGWPVWYIVLWGVPLALLLLPTTPRARLISVAAMASILAALATWSASLERRMELARGDLDRLGAPSDPVAVRALEEFGAIGREAHATRLDRLYGAWRASSLARAGVPTYLSLWDGDGHQHEVVALDSLNISYYELAPYVPQMAQSTEPRRFPLRLGTGHHEVLVLPLATDTIATVTIGPRSLLFAPTTFGLLTGWRTPREAPYRVDVVADGGPQPDTAFRRTHRFVRAERTVKAGDGTSTVRAEIEISPPRQFAVRALLVVFLDVVLVLVIWRVLRRVLDRRRALTTPFFRRSYRRTVATALTAFFIVPATMFTVWSVVRLRQDATAQHLAELAETLRDVAVDGGFSLAEAPRPSTDSLAVIADVVNAELAVYRDRRLIAASTPMLQELGLFPPILDPSFTLPTGAEAKPIPSPLPRIGARLGLEATSLPGTFVVVALPGSDTDLEREQIDLGLLLLLASLAGGAAAIAVAGPVARALGKPIEALRQTALAIGRHELPPETTAVPAEFVPVFGALTQMEHDLRASEAQLQAGRARTAAILSTVATGVIGVDASGAVIHANPRAEQLLGMTMDAGQALVEQLPAVWQPVAQGIRRLLGSTTRSPESRELQVGDQRLAVTLAPLGDGGLVLAITDITEASRAARIVAWGEMARQVAHEIKNPLTPMRLGLQHLRRITADGHADYARIVDQTAERLLGEIERLDRIARSFARYGTPPDREGTPLEPIALRAAVEELIGLFTLTSERPRIEVVGDTDGPVPARQEELVQVILNLLDNSRQAGASTIRLVLSGYTLRVEDDGRGIPADQLGRIFEPSFSTNTSGTGLGLAIVRRLVEGWGGSIEAASEPQHGATFTLRFAGPS